MYKGIQKNNCQCYYFDDVLTHIKDVKELLGQIGGRPGSILFELPASLERAEKGVVPSTGQKAGPIIPST